MKKILCAVALVLLLASVASAQYLQFHPVTPNNPPPYQPFNQYEHQQAVRPYTQVPVRPLQNPYDQQRQNISPLGSYANPYYIAPVNPRYDQTGSSYR